MRIPSYACVVLATVLLTIPCRGGEKVNLLPGLTYYGNHEELEGRLVFLASAEALPPTNGLKQCFVYEFDLRRKRLSDVVETPISKFFSDFLVSADGRSYAVFYPKQPDNDRVRLALRRDPEWAWLYSEDAQRSHQLSVPAVPRHWITGRGHFLFDLGSRILHVDVNTGTETYLEAPDLGRLPHEDYQFLSGRNFERPHATDYRCFDGRFVWFAGDSSPISGTELMSASFPNQYQQWSEDPKGRTMKRLKKFPRSRLVSYNLLQLSPCRHYAFVCQTRWVNPLSPTKCHTVKTYYVVNVSSGRTWPSCRNENDVDGKTGGYMSEIAWVPSRPSKP
jgi:hypothetical protein